MAKKKYSEVDRLKYHNERETACSKFGLNFGDTKHSYSSGFVDGVMGRDNTGAVRHEFGSKSSKSYASGYRRGRAAAFSYLDKTGKQLSNEKYKL